MARLFTPNTSLGALRLAIAAVLGCPLMSAAQDTEISSDSASSAIRAQSGMIETGTPAAAEAPESLTVADVIASVYRSYPAINLARQQANVANGQRLEASGAYDTNLRAASTSEPTGFYRNYRHQLGVARQVWWGGNVFAGYRVGRGIFQPWYLERETEKGGEFKVGFQQPLLKGRAIDPQRFAVFQASLARRLADPLLQEAILRTSRDALSTYWRWVAMGNELQAQRELLSLAETRGQQYQAGFEAGKFPEIDIVLNQQLIAERRAQAIETESKYRESKFKLAMYLRDEQGRPLTPEDAWLPPAFPMIGSLPEFDVQAEVSMALQRRPEPQRLQLELRQLELDRRLSRNETLPKLDLLVEGSQNVGRAGSSADDKGEFVLVVGAASEVPIQRRRARGRLQSTSARIAQTNEKLRLHRDRIAIEIQTALMNLDLAAQVVEQAELSFRSALDTLQRFRFAFDRGKIDLIYLNLLETKANETKIKLIQARQSWFIKLATYQAAAGLDPLEQAGSLIELPILEMDESIRSEESDAPEDPEERSQP